MHALSIRALSLEELCEWDQIITRFDGWRIFHTKSWVDYLQSFSKGHALFLIFEKNGTVVGAIPGILLKITVFKAFMSPMEGWQTQSLGPVFDRKMTSDQEIVDALIPFLLKTYGVQYIEISSTFLDSYVMKSAGFHGEAIYTQRAQLCPQKPEETFAGIKSKTRNQIRKALKQGLKVRFEQSEQFVEEFYEQLLSIFIRGGNTMPFSKERVESLIKHLAGSDNLLTISVYLPEGKECIATGIFLVGGGELYLWGWTHRREHGSKCPIELLTWTAMKKASESGCSVFDLAGGGAAKKKYGGIADETTYRWIWSKYPVALTLRELARRFYRWQQSTRGQLVQKTKKYLPSFIALR